MYLFNMLLHYIICYYYYEIGNKLSYPKLSYPTTRTTWTKVSLFSHVIPMSAAHRLPSSSITSACNTGCGRIRTGAKPYYFTISERSVRALTLAIFSARSCSYALCILAVSWDTAAIAPFSVLTMFSISQYVVA